MKTAVWKAAIAGVALFILGVAAGAATIDMLGEDEPMTLTRNRPVTTVEEIETAVTHTRSVTVESEETLPSGWSVCANRRRGYSIGYPGGWYTTHLRPAQACEYFNPEPFDILEGTEFPSTALFVTIALEPFDTYVEQLTDPMFFDTVRRENTKVQGLDAVLVETVAIQGENEPGERQYGYVVDASCLTTGTGEDECVKSGRVFVVLATALAGDERYEEFKKVADEAVETVRFL